MVRLSTIISVKYAFQTRFVGKLPLFFLRIEYWWCGIVRCCCCCSLTLKLGSIDAVDAGVRFSFSFFLLTPASPGWAALAACSVRGLSKRHLLETGHSSFNLKVLLVLPTLSECVSMTGIMNDLRWLFAAPTGRRERTPRVLSDYHQLGNHEAS